jgi:hypothetical protein
MGDRGHEAVHKCKHCGALLIVGLLLMALAWQRIRMILWVYATTT